MEKTEVCESENRFGEIYTITVFETLTARDGGFDFEGSRLVGFVYSFADALRCILKNMCDIREDTYRYAAIQTFSPGLYNSEGECTVYLWEDKNQTYRPYVHTYNNFVSPMIFG